jgi:DUF2934 family protein
MQDLEQTIRERAYHLWIADGCREGNAEGHWLSAQREVLAKSLGSFARVKVDETKTTMKVDKKLARKLAKAKRRAA